MKMEKIIKRPSGFKIRLTITFYDMYIGNCEYGVYTDVCDKKIRTFRAPIDDSERATVDEIHSAKLELWESMKPKIGE